MPRRGPLKLARRLPVATIAATLALLAGSTVPAVAASPAPTLEASPSHITFGDGVTLSGSAPDEAGCAAGRTARLEWSPSDSAVWTLRTSTTTGTDGSFTFADSPTGTGWYRIELVPSGGCPSASSDPVRVLVRARVDVSILASGLTAGSCPSLTTIVSPPKPGQQVEVQGRSPSGWVVLDELTLDRDSSARARPCFGFDDLGIVRLRVRWPAQDPANATGTSPALSFRIEKAPWMRRIDRLIGGRPVSVAVGVDGTALYERAGDVPRTPASNEKLLLSMALLDRLGAGHRIATIAAAASVDGGVVPGNLWILGRGDPEIRRARMGALARRLAEAGIRRIQGRVMGAVSYFRHDWWAEGWRPGITRRYVAPPTALTFDENRTGNGYTMSPERLAAESLTRRLRALGIRVSGTPGAGAPPDGLTDVAEIRSRPLLTLLLRMNRPSDNFYAEVLGKLLAATSDGPPGTIAKGAGVLRSWVTSHGAAFSLHDGSGLSYANRVTAAGILHLLGVADGTSWGRVLRGTLATGGQGTLEDRLHGERVRAKTGTLDNVSALSGWVWLERDRAWAEFSILSALPKWLAIRIEDGIVRTLSAHAR